MPKISEEEMSERQVAVLIEQAEAAVDDGWNRRGHMTPAMFKFLELLTIVSGQGSYTTTIVLLGALPALCNGAKT